MSKKIEILEAGKKDIDELINVLLEQIITHAEDEITADKLKNAASAKKLAFDDALSMLHKIEEEENKDKNVDILKIDHGRQGFAEGRAKNGK